jgi:hypothetical protein
MRHEADGDFECKECDVKFPNRRKLDRHVRDVHSDEETVSVYCLST